MIYYYYYDSSLLLVGGETKTAVENVIESNAYVCVFLLLLFVLCVYMYDICVRVCTRISHMRSKTFVYYLICSSAVCTRILFSICCRDRIEVEKTNVRQLLVAGSLKV